MGYPTQKAHKDYATKSKSYSGVSGKGVWLLLTFDHAAKEALWNQDSNRFAVIFNGKTILDYHEIHHQKLVLYGRYGKNEIHFVGKGLSDARGSQVDNIKLIRKVGKGYKNYI